MSSTCQNCGIEFTPPPDNKARRSCSRSCAVALAWKDPESSARRRASIEKARRTPESRARSVAANNRRWARPGEREKLSERNRKMWAKPRMRKKLSKAIRAAQGTPEQRAFYSRMRTAQWADPEYRRKTIEGIQRSKGSPEARALFSKLLRERWTDPAMRAKYTAANANRNNPEHRARLSAMMLKRWATDEAYRATILEAMKIYHGSPEAQAIKSARMKALWADPVWRIRQLDLVGRSPNTPEPIRRKLSVRPLNGAVDLMAEIDRVVPRSLPEFARGDICQDLMVALLEGSLKLSDLAKGAKSYLTEYRKMFPDKFGPLSIDAPIPGTEGFTIADTLSNDTPHF